MGGDVFSLPTAATALSNRAVVKRLFALAWRYRVQCLRVLGLQLVLLTLGISGLSLTGVGIDYIRHKTAPAVAAAAEAATATNTSSLISRAYLALPESWPYWKVLGLLAAVILLLAICRAFLNYT